MKFIPLLEVADNITCSPTVFDGTRTYYATANVDEQNLLEGTPVTYWERPSRANLVAANDDILFAKMQATNKIIHVNPDAENAIFSTGFFNLRPRPTRLHSRYLLWFLRSSIFQNAKDQLCTGAIQRALTLSGLQEIEIPLPATIDEQKRVATILDTADSIRRKRRETVLLADKFLRSAFLKIFGNPNKNPHGWSLGTIRNLVSEVKYGTSQKASTQKKKYKILRMGNITYSGQLDIRDLKYVDIEPELTDKYTVKKDDILFNRTNSKELVGKTTVFDLEEPFAYAGYLVRARVNEHADPYYISGYLNSDYGKSILQSICKSIVGMANINAQEFQNIPILIPPIERQKEYRRVVESVKKQTHKWQTALNESELLFASLSQQAFQGKL